MSTNEGEQNKKAAGKRKSVYQKIMEIDIDLCQKVFREYDIHNTGYINYYDLKAALEKVGVSFYYSQCFHKMISELKEQTGQVSFFEFTKLVVKHCKNDITDEGLQDAFVAMGGQEDGGGSIDADKLINIIKKDFGMTIDIEG